MYSFFAFLPVLDLFFTSFLIISMIQIFNMNPKYALPKICSLFFLLNICKNKSNYRNMQKDRFIGTFSLLYALELVISAYIAFWNRFTLEDVAMRYGKIFLNFQVHNHGLYYYHSRSGGFSLLCFWLDIPCPMHCYSFGYCIVWLYINEYQSVSSSNVWRSSCDGCKRYAPYILFSCRFKHSYQFRSISCFCCSWFLGILWIHFFNHNLDYVLVLSSLLWSLFHDNDSVHDWHNAWSWRDYGNSGYFDSSKVIERIGFSVKRKVLPFAYAFITLIVNNTIMCELFAIAWGSLFLKLYRVLGISPFSEEVEWSTFFFYSGMDCLWNVWITLSCHL